jgi:hypothetical protein
VVIEVTIQAESCAAAQRGLANVAAHYRPLHPEVYSWLLPPHALSTQAPTFGINSNISCYLLPDVPEAGTHSQSLLEPYSGVFVFPLLAPWFCERIWSELHNYETNAQQSQHRTPADWLPLHVRHDGNMGNLQVHGLHILNVSLAIFLKGLWLRASFGCSRGSGAAVCQRAAAGAGPRGTLGFKKEDADFYCNRSAITPS